MSDDHSPGDARKPYSDRGGPEGRHAETHDVRREELTNPKGPEPEDTSFAEQLTPAETGGPGGHGDETVSAVDDKELHRQLNELDSAELGRLSILAEGERLEQGGTYLDLDNRAAGPFKALGGHIVSGKDRIVAKRETDYELWNRLTGDDREPEIERPGASA